MLIEGVGFAGYCESQMSDPRKHHIVPQLYQKGFARRTGNVWKAIVLDRRTGQPRGPMTVRDIFAERDYNTIVDADGNRDFSAEGLLAEHVEDVAAGGLQALRAGAFRSATTTVSRFPFSWPPN
jgi:Protein of unknown function (DUF4238)